jgi:hypothetical protein
VPPKLHGFTLSIFAFFDKPRAWQTQKGGKLMRSLRRSCELLFFYELLRQVLKGEFCKSFKKMCHSCRQRQTRGMGFF